MSTNDAGTLVWSVRSFVYAHIVEHGHPPTVAATAAALGVLPEQARDAFHDLDRRHALFLQPGTDTIRMAHPFSGVPTPFRVRVGDRSYWANCAWDALGIPAALNQDATIEAVHADDGSPVSLTITDGQVRGPNALIHFPIPFRDWYADLIRT